MTATLSIVADHIHLFMTFFQQDMSQKHLKLIS